MIDLCKLIWCAFVGLFRSRAALEAEILVLRHQLNVLRRKSPGRLAFSSIDRLVFAGICALAPNILDGSCRQGSGDPKPTPHLTLDVDHLVRLREPDVDHSCLERISGLIFLPFQFQPTERRQL